MPASVSEAVRPLFDFFTLVALYPGHESNVPLAARGMRPAETVDATASEAQRRRLRIAMMAKGRGEKRG